MEGAMAGRKGLTGAGAASLAVMATLAGAPAAGAQAVCLKCPEPNPDGGSAFLKITQLGTPGATFGVFYKEAPVPPAFYKIGELIYPGGTEDVFLKFNKE
jgi:hypothetical protein